MTSKSVMLASLKMECEVLFAMIIGKTLSAKTLAAQLSTELNCQNVFHVKIDNNKDLSQFSWIVYEFLPC